MFKQWPLLVLTEPPKLKEMWMFRVKLNLMDRVDRVQRLPREATGDTPVCFNQISIGVKSS